MFLLASCSCLFMKNVHSKYNVSFAEALDNIITNNEKAIFPTTMLARLLLSNIIGILAHKEVI